MSVGPGAAGHAATAGHGPQEGATPDEPDRPQGGWRRLALAGGAGMFVVMGLGRFSYTAMVPALIASGELTAVEAGRIGMANLAGFFLGAAGSVWAVRRFERVRVLSVSIVLAIVALAASAVPNGFLWLAGCRGLIGIATGLVMVHSLALIAETAPATARATASAYVFAGVGLGILTAGVAVPMLLVQGVAVSWAVLAAAGLLGGLAAIGGWRRAPRTPSAPGRFGSGDALAGSEMRSLLVAQGLFSLGIVPHTLYWIDYLVRGLGLSIAVGGWHWSLVGILAIAGPLLTAALARAIGTAPALILAFLAMAGGLAAPALWPLAPVLWLSSALFGAQPGLSSLMAARARDVAGHGDMGPVMRAMILSNGIGAVLGGLLAPWAYGATGRHEPLFLIGGAAMALGALAAAPGAWRRPTG